MLGVIASVLALVCNNSQQYWDLQCILGRIQPIRLRKPCQMRVRGANMCKRPDSALLCYALVIKEQKKCWELLAQTFDPLPALRNNSQQHATTCNRMCKRTQHVTSNIVKFLEFHSTKQGVPLVDSWSGGLD